MVNFVGYNQKLARTSGQINFLLDCRTLKVMPRFISDKTTHIKKHHPNRRVTAQVSTLQRTILNEEIRDAFRRKAFLQRSMSRSCAIIGETTVEWRWLHSRCIVLFKDELTTVKDRLSRKLTGICEKAGHLNFDISRTRTHKLVDIVLQTTDTTRDGPTRQLTSQSVTGQAGYAEGEPLGQLPSERATADANNIENEPIRQPAGHQPTTSDVNTTENEHLHQPSQSVTDGTDQPHGRSKMDSHS